MEVRVSIIIPCYNYGHYLEETFKSLRQQSYPYWECIVVDDGSTDYTANLVQRFASLDSRIHYLYQFNQGQPVARNTGLAHARADFIQFLDADDLLEPEKLFHQVHFLDEHPETDIVYGDVRYFTNDEPEKLLLNRWNDSGEEWMTKISGQGLPVVKAYIKQNLFELGCALFRRKSLAGIGLFNKSLQGVEDYEYCFKAAIHELHFFYLNCKNTRVLMRHHAGSFSKGLVKMYKKELILRKFFNKSIQRSNYTGLRTINESWYSWRLKKLQNLIIDQTRKGNREYLTVDEFLWLFSHSSIGANFYFFPRIIKAALF